MYKYEDLQRTSARSKKDMPLQNCPSCGAIIGAMAGGRDATCKTCGYKDPCCE